MPLYPAAPARFKLPRDCWATGERLARGMPHAK